MHCFVTLILAYQFQCCASHLFSDNNNNRVKSYSTVTRKSSLLKENSGHLTMKVFNYEIYTLNTDFSMSAASFCVLLFNYDSLKGPIPSILLFLFTL